jgi:hypothetical protein
MGLPKGKTNNPNGRPKGSQNKLAKNLRERIVDILDSDFTPEKIRYDLNQLKPEDRLAMLIKLMDFAIPRLKQVDFQGNINLNELPYNGCIFNKPRTIDA